MNETSQPTPEAEDKRVPVAEAYSLAIEGDKLETEKVPHKLAKRAIETAYITGETPIEVVNRSVAKDRVNPNFKEEIVFGQPGTSEIPEEGSPRANMLEARNRLERMNSSYSPVSELSAEDLREKLDKSVFSEKINEMDEKLDAIYAKKPVSEDQKARAAALGHNPDNMRLL